MPSISRLSLLFGPSCLVLLRRLPHEGFQVAPQPVAELAFLQLGELHSHRVDRLGETAVQELQRVVEMGGVLMTSVARTLIDLARGASTAAAVVPIDASLHRRLTTLTERS